MQIFVMQEGFLLYFFVKFAIHEEKNRHFLTKNTNKLS
jgi:hypothetical protein